MPTREEMISYLSGQNTSKPSREEMIAHLSGQTIPQNQTAPPSVPVNQYESVLDKVGEGLGLASKAGQYAGHVLDYPGGIVRTGIATAIDPFLGKDKNIVNTQDWLNALAGKAPNSAEYMNRAGVPEMGSVDTHIPLVGKVSGRGALGFVADVLTDPMSAISKIGKGTEALGTTAYKSGLKKIDQVVIDKGARPLSDILMENGISGTTKTIRKESQNLLKNAKEERNALYQTSDQAGIVVNPEIALAPAYKEAERIGAADPGLKDMTDKIQEKLKLYIDKGPVPISQASEWKTNLYNALPESAYNKFGKLKGPADKIQKLSANGLKEEIVNQANTFQPGMGDQINKSNETMQTLLLSQKPLKKAANAAKNINAFTSVDAMLGGASAMASHNPYQTAAVLATKKAADLAKTTGARTMVGYGLNRAGKALQQTPQLGPDIFPQLGYATGARALYSPWLKVNGENK